MATTMATTNYQPTGPEALQQLVSDALATSGAQITDSGTVEGERPFLYLIVNFQGHTYMVEVHDDPEEVGDDLGDFVDD